MKVNERTKEVENTELIRKELGSKGQVQALKSRAAQAGNSTGTDQVNLEISKAILDIVNDDPKKDLEAIKRKYANGQFPNDLAEKVSGALDEQVSVLQVLDKDPSEAA